MDLKRIALALCALGLTGVVSAGGFMSAPECRNHPVTVPCEHTGWDFGVTGYWGRMTSEYMTTDAIRAPDSNIPARLIAVDPDYRFAFGLEGSYHWGNGNDVTLQWDHFNKSYQEREILETDTITGSEGDLAINSASFKFDTLNLELGQKIDVGPKWDMRTHAGLQYMRLRRNLNEQIIFDADFSNGNFTDVLIASRFAGVGPRVGLDGAYHLTNDWSLIGDAAVSVLAGRVKNRVHAVTFDDFDPEAVVDSYAYKANKLVAGIDGRVGLKYDYAMNAGLMSITGGYTGSIFMNPVIGSPLIDSGFLLEVLHGSFSAGSFFLSAKYTS